MDNKVDKTLVSVALFCITIVLVIAEIIGPAKSYEISLYGAYPIYFWLIFLGAFTCGVTILVRHAFGKSESNWWLAGVAIVIIVNSIFLLLPQFRGYAFGGAGDDLTHLGEMKDILNNGYLGLQNIYPAEHILGVNLILVAGIPLESIPPIFYVMFSAIYIVGVAMLAKSVSSVRGQAILIIALGSPLVYSLLNSTDIQPQAFSLFMLPFLLFAYHKIERFHNARGYIVLLFVLALGITYFHPITTLVTIAILLTLGIARLLFSRYFKLEATNLMSFIIVPLVSLMFVSFCIWYLSFSFIQQSITQIYEWLVLQIGSPLFKESINLLSLADLPRSQLVWLLINRYGAVFLLFVIAGISMIFVFNRTRLRKENVNLNEFSYAALFLVTTGIGIGMALIYYSGANLFRVAEFGLLMSTVLTGITLYNWGAKRSNKLLPVIATIALVVIIAILGYGNVYYSPRIAIPNGEMTYSEKNGKEWVLSNQDINITTISNLSIDMSKFENYFYGYETPAVRAVIDPNRLPDHFGYQEYKEIGMALGGARYVVLSEADIMGVNAFPSSIQALVHQWTPGDLANLANDPTASEIYINGGFAVWKVIGV